MIELSAIRAAGRRIHDDVIRTATILSPGLSAKLLRPVYLKLENTQTGGSFKARGVLNKFANLPAELSSKRFVAVSGGNFGIAVAQASTKFDVDVTIVMPRSAPTSSIEAIRALRVPVIVTDDVLDAFSQAENLAQQGYIVLDDCADSAIAEGHGTLGLEFIEDCPAMTDVFVAVGGGAMLAGVATALKAIKPEIRIWGVETAGANSMDRALRAGVPVEIEVTSMVSTLGVPIVTDFMLMHAKAYVDEIVVTSDREAIEGMVAFGENAKQWVELASGAVLAAAMKIVHELPSDAVVGLVVCGGNVDHREMQNWTAYTQTT